MDSVASRCLLCLVKVEPGSTINENVAESPSLLQTTPNLQRQLDVFFLLRHVLQLPLTHLKRYLKVRGDPISWIFLCGSCDDLVKKVKEIFVQLQRISEKYDEARMKVEERIKATSLIKVVDTDNDFILEQCRHFICQRKVAAIKRTSFLEGDFRAQHLLRNYKQKREDGNVLAGIGTEEVTQEAVEIETLSHVPDEGLDQPDTLNWLLEVEETDPSFPVIDEHLHLSEDHKSDSEIDSKDAIKLERSSTNKLSLRKQKREQLTSKPGSKPEVMRKRRKKGPRITMKRTKKSTPRVKLDKDELRKRMTCQFCQKVLPYRGSLKRHLFRVHQYYEGKPPKTFTCTVQGCENIFNEKQYYLDHMEWHEMEVKPYCAICKKDFASQFKQDMHDLIIHKIVKPSTQNRKVFDCPKCGKRFNSVVLGNKHSLACRGKKKKPEGPLECDLCQTKCATPKDLRIHEKFKHSIILKESKEEMEESEPEEPDPDNDFPCPHCGKICRGEFTLDLHVKNVHPTGEPKFICPICPDKKYRVKTDFDRHLARCHEIGIENYKCSLCGKFCKAKAEKKRHVCGVPDRPRNVCETCGKEFSAKNMLKRHIREAHEPVLDIFCNLCEFRTSRQQYLAFHQASKHKIGMKCEVESCTRYFASEKMLRDHLKKMHPEGERENKFLCTECGKGCYDLRALNVHIKLKHPK